MREIKFRAWDGERLRKVNTIGWVDEGVDFVTTPRYSGPAEDFRLMQYTGLKDNNGVEIYEGDIVKNIRNGISRKVYWDTHCASFHLSKRGREKPDVEYWSLSNPKWNYEVIGNIYGNPELLESDN